MDKLFRTHSEYRAPLLAEIERYDQYLPDSSALSSYNNYKALKRAAQ